MKRELLSTVLVFFIFLLGASAVHAATRTVDRTDDPVPAASACTSAANDCSLRGAIESAAAGDKIDFALSGNVQINLTSRIAFNRSLTVSGPGTSQLTIKGMPNDNVF